MDNLERLDSLLREFDELSRRSVGYPCNLDFDYTALLPFMRYVINNVGDPFHDSNFQSNTHEIEREVIGIFADLMHISREQVWGYVTSGGTEGNMYGLYLGRELFPDGVVYFSQDTHYSVVKIMSVLKVRNIMIRSQDNGEIDYDDLHETIRINRDVPAIVMANIGTTMKGAIDDVSRIREHPGRPRVDQVLPARGRCPERHDPAVRRRPAALRVRCRLRQRCDQRAQDGRLATALRRRA